MRLKFDVNDDLRSSLTVTRRARNGIKIDGVTSPRSVLTVPCSGVSRYYPAKPYLPGLSAQLGCTIVRWRAP